MVEVVKGGDPPYDPAIIAAHSAEKIEVCVDWWRPSIWPWDTAVDRAVDMAVDIAINMAVDMAASYGRTGRPYHPCDLPVVYCAPLQCKWRAAAERVIVLEANPIGGGPVGAARAAYQDVGLLPFILPAFEDPAFAVLMGGVEMYIRMPSDVMHMVQHCVRTIMAYLSCLYVIWP